MTVYNITIQVDWAIADQWLSWQKQEQIPAIMATGFFDEYKIFRLQDQEDADGPTFILQLFTSSNERYRRYADAFDAPIWQKAFERWNDRFIIHRTSMQLVH